MPPLTLSTEAMATLLATLGGFQPPSPSRADEIGNAFQAHARLSSVLAPLWLGSSSDRRARAAFAARHRQAWAELASNLANWPEISESLDLQARERVLLAGWHFPELPRVFSFLQRSQALLLVSQPAPWLDGLARTGHTANFQTPEGRRLIAAGIAAGRIIGTMLDHVHAGTATVTVPFLGRAVATASDLIAQCLARDYTVAVLGARDGTVAIVDRFPGTGITAADAAGRIHRVFEAEIRRAPDRWLMWPALPARRRA